MSTGYLPFSSDGHEAQWTTWDADGEETTTLQWENEGWTVSGTVSRERVQYVVRITPTWKVSQFILFRDLDEPDLWLATDGTARWGEMNGAHRPELDGCYDIDLACTPFTNVLPIRRLPLLTGDAAEIPVVMIDAETLDVHAETHRYTRLETHRWQFDQLHTGYSVEFDVDEHGLVIDYPGLFRGGSVSLMAALTGSDRIGFPELAASLVFWLAVSTALVWCSKGLGGIRRRLARPRDPGPHRG